MDSKQIYRTFGSKFNLTNWLNQYGELAQSEDEVHWQSFGVGGEFDQAKMLTELQNFFQEKEVYLCISSGKSFLTSLENAVIEMASFIGKKEIGILDKNFTKLLFFSHIGTFEKGIIREFPKARPRPENGVLQVGFHANISMTKDKTPDILRPYLEQLSEALSKDYGGVMEHFWVDFELMDGLPFAFRLQSRVSVKTSYTEFYCYNVAHYSVKPDYETLNHLQTDTEKASYLLQLLYNSFEILDKNKKKIGDFNTEKFRSDFVKECETMGIFVG